MSDVLVLGYRADGRAVHWIRGGAEGDGGAAAGDGNAGAGAGDGNPAGSGGASGQAGQGAQSGSGAQRAGAGDGEEIEYNEENFKKLIDDLNRERTERAELEAKHQQEKHSLSSEAKKYRLRARSLADMLGDEATGKPGPKAAAKGAQGQQQDAGPDPEVARLAAQLEETRARMLASEAQAELLRAEANPKHVQRLARMLDLNADGREDVASLAEQIAELKADMPELFGTPAAATAGAGNGAGTGARVLRAAPAVAGRGAAGRGGNEAAQPPKSANIQADRLLGRSEPSV